MIKETSCNACDIRVMPCCGAWGCVVLLATLYCARLATIPADSAVLGRYHLCLKHRARFSQLQPKGILRCYKAQPTMQRPS